MENDRPRPWSGIEVPTNGLGARRADPRHPLDFFWVRDEGGRVGLMLRLSGPQNAVVKVDLAGVDVELREDVVTGTSSLLLLLQDAADADLFAALGGDLLESTAALTDAGVGLGVVVRRLQRWQGLLSRPRHTRLTALQLQGLFGELTLLDRVLLPRLGPQGTIHAWQGPLGSPQDFAIGSMAIEVKAILGTARQEIRISSAEQLDSSLAELLLVAVTLSVAWERDGASVPELVATLRSRIKEGDATCLEGFNDRLVAVGYADLDDYEGNRFSVERLDWFRVDGAFPRIRPASLPVGISKVGYTLSVAACQAYRVAPPFAEIP